MNNLERIFAQPMIETLGWTLIHFIWQGALVAVLYALIKVAFKQSTASIRYGLACSMLFIMMIFPLVTFWAVSSSVTPTEVFAVEEMEWSIIDNSISAVSSPSLSPIPTTESNRLWQWISTQIDMLLPYLVGIWGLGVLGLGFRFARGWLMLRNLKQSEQDLTSYEWHSLVAKLCEKLQVSRPVRLCESVLVEVPTVIGYLRPIILIPTSALMGLSVAQIETILAHELAHIRRHDYLVNIWQTTIETLFFYHPAVWWVSQQIRLEREHCCDDWAVATCGDVLTYARALTELEQLRSEVLPLALAVNGGSLLARIQRLLKQSSRTPRGAASWVVGAIALMTVFSFCIAAQTVLFSYRSNTARNSLDTLSASSLGKVFILDNDQQDKNRDEDADEDEDSDNENEVEEAECNVETVEEDCQIDDVEKEVEEYLAAVVKNWPNLDKDWTKLENALDNVDELGEMINKLEVLREGLNQLKYAGVSPEFMRQLKQLGYNHLSLNEVVALKYAGISTEFIKSLKELGYSNISTDELIALHYSEVTLSYIAQLKDLGYTSLTVDELIDLSQAGVTPDFIRDVRKARGNRQLSIDELIGLRYTRGFSSPQQY